MLRGEEAGDVLAARVDELADPEHDLRPPRERERAPGRERGLRRGHRPVDLLDRGEVDLAGLPSGGRVVDGAAAAGLSGHAPAADPVVDPGDLRARSNAVLLHELRHLCPPSSPRAA